MSVTKLFAAVAAVTLALGLSATEARAEGASLVGYWTCTGQFNGINYNNTFDYRADGTYESTQRMTAGDNMLEGGGGGTYRFENGTLHDTKGRASLTRLVRNGVDVPPTDPEWQALYAQSQSNIGATTTGPVQMQGDTLTAGFLTCQRQPRSPS